MLGNKQARTDWMIDRAFSFAPECKLDVTEGLHQTLLAPAHSATAFSNKEVLWLIWLKAFSFTDRNNIIYLQTALYIYNYLLKR